MFGFLKSLFAPPSQQAIKDATGRKLFNDERRRRMRTIKMSNEKAPNNGGGRVNLNGLKKESNKMVERRLDELLKKNDLSTSARPNVKVNKNDKTKLVTFIVPFSTPNKLTSARVYLNSMKNDKQNRGQFKNINIVNVNTNDSILTFTLSSSKNMTIPIPQHFVEKIYGVDVDLFKKSKIKKEDVMNWSKYRRVGKKIKYVKHLVDVSELFETKPFQKLYGPAGPWETYGDRVASKVEEMRRVVDPKNFVKFLGTTSQQSNAIGAQLFEAMKTYIDLEERVFKNKTKIDVQPLYRDYIAAQRGRLILGAEHLPKFCNIPFDWRVHLVHATMLDSNNERTGTNIGAPAAAFDMLSNAARNNFANRLEGVPGAPGAPGGVGGTWIDFQLHLVQSMNVALTTGGAVIGAAKVGNDQNVKVNALLVRYRPDGTRTHKTINHMNGSLPPDASAFYYNLFLKKYRPFLKQSFHTIGSIRYPHADDVPCPLTKRNDVWQYEFTKKRHVNTVINSDDSWLKLLYEREGYVETLKKAHEYIEFCLNELVKYYKMKVPVERRRLNANNNEKQKTLDINLAWELYSICEKSKLYEHPMFRVCAGFRVLNSPNPQGSKFMDRFRYMVHNRPQQNSRSEPPPITNNFKNLSNVEYILTQNDVKYFFMSSDLYDSSKYMIKKFAHNNVTDSTPFERTNNTKNNKGDNVPQLDCSPLSNEGMKLLEQNKQTKQTKSGNFLLAWPTLHDASAYYKS